MTDLRTYLRDKLTADGFSGLWCDIPCGCALDDLFACDSDAQLCAPGYRRNCDGCPRQAEDNCPVDEGPDVSYCIGPKPEYPEARDE